MRKFYLYFYLNIFGNNDNNPSFRKEQLPATAARSGFGWMFSHASTGSWQVKTFSEKTTTTTVKTFKFIAVNALFAAWSIPYIKSYFLCGVYCFPTNQIKRNFIDPFSQRSLFGDHTTDKEPKWPRAQDWCGVHCFSINQSKKLN